MFEHNYAQHWYEEVKLNDHNYSRGWYKAPPDLELGQGEISNVGLDQRETIQDCEKAPEVSGSVCRTKRKQLSVTGKVKKNILITTNRS